MIFSSPQNKLSDVNKTYIDISNGQKFELLIQYSLYVDLNNEAKPNYEY